MTLYNFWHVRVDKYWGPIYPHIYFNIKRELPNGQLFAFTNYLFVKNVSNLIECSIKMGQL